MRSLALFILAGTLTALGCNAQSATELPANTVIPNPAPTAPLSMWHVSQGRQAISIEREGATLRGFRYPGKDAAAPTILFFNGNGMTVSRADQLYKTMAALGPTVVVYDYRGYGFSTGKTDLAKFRDDGVALYDETAKAAANHRVIAYGFSMGTSIATYIATQRTVTATILAAPIASAEEEFPVFGRAMGYPAAALAMMQPAADAKTIFGEARLVTQSTSPLLVLHGTADQLVPIEQGKEIFAASPSAVKKFVPLPGVEHNGTAMARASLDAVAAFIANL